MTAAVAGAAAVVLLGGGQALAASNWTIAPTPPTGAGNTSLNAVAAIPGTDGAWAVGGHNETVGAPLYNFPFIDSWNGTSWAQASLPANSPFVADLTSVSASSASDAWAVGYTTPDLVEQAPVAFHWNGTAWSVLTPPLYGEYTYLVAVSDISPTDAYAVGYDTLTSLSYIVHWNGTSWSAVTIPEPGTVTKTSHDGTELYSISADGPNDVWAVGSYFTPSGQIGAYSLHFNGTTWSVATVPPVSGASSSTKYALTSVVANSPTDVWAVGDSFQGGATVYNPQNSTASSTLIAHWNGTAWSVVSSPSPGSQDHLTGVATSNAANDISAVGYYTPAGASSPQTLILSWNGTVWSTVTSPNASASDALAGVAATPGGVFAVGASLSGSAQSALLLQGS